MTISSIPRRIWALLTLPFRYVRFRWIKWKYRKSFGPWMRWGVNRKTRSEILKNGWTRYPNFFSINRFPVEEPNVPPDRGLQAWFEHIDVTY